MNLFVPVRTWRLKHLSLRESSNFTCVMWFIRICTKFVGVGLACQKCNIFYYYVLRRLKITKRIVTFLLERLAVSPIHDLIWTLEGTSHLSMAYKQIIFEINTRFACYKFNFPEIQTFGVFILLQSPRVVSPWNARSRSKRTPSSSKF